MATVTFELDERKERRLREVAEEERRSAQDVYREAVDLFLATRRPTQSEPGIDRNSALRGMIGLVERGPVDASIAHDFRPGDPA